MINGYSEEEFGKEVHRHVRPSEPIDTIQLLKGRQEELDEIRRALFAKGRHIFIYGDRGIGKSSLAQTAAYQYQSADASIIQIGCTKTSTFLEIMESIARNLIDSLDSVEIQTKASLNLKIVNLETTYKTSSKPETPKVSNMDQALDVISDVREIHSDKPIIVIDEFDAIAIQEERFKFAEFLKKMGDSGIYVPIIFSGIATSLDDLLGGHLSSIRQLKPIQLSPISWDSRWDILVEALEAFDIDFDEEIKYRVAGISDGFPYYVHLITEHLLWAVYDDPETNCKASSRHYMTALENAVKDIQEHIRKPYDKATLRHSQDFHHIIWAAAESDNLHRNIDSMYSSYERILRDLSKKEHSEKLSPIDRKKFSQRLSTLTKESHGSVLRKMNENRNGWYQFSENMLRGFVRLLAETHGVQLWLQEAKAPKQLIHPRPQPMGGSSRYQSLVPHGVGLKDDK
ncbi:DNA-binding protein [Pseudomonas antarctica]|uniref:DNA-binding protein n=1 Tax=Pseudomonas antarctica TaxID=219572 RepID=A0A172Z5G2_9PSED|nr:ATP-binding protein [Pseudomonas antarctica]ANF87727.1 DNA-binding protein [Pseudomonas antarctica]